MNQLNPHNLINKRLILIASFICINNPVFADGSLSSAIDCSSISINYVESPEMTQSERLEAMNRAFFESLNQFELCNLSTQSNLQSQALSESQPNLDNESTEESESIAENNEAALESVQSSSMTGTEPESVTPDLDAAFDSVETESLEEQDAGEENAIAVYGGGTNGKIPEDIPNAKNDDAVAAQIRLAAEIETDPDKKEKLWNEYRKYKGLPVKQ
jgi:hypothetical protein